MSTFWMWKRLTSESRAALLPIITTFRRWPNTRTREINTLPSRLAGESEHYMYLYETVFYNISAFTSSFGTLRLHSKQDKAMAFSQSFCCPCTHPSFSN
jgi:hypothetical protein